MTEPFSRFNELMSLLTIGAQMLTLALAAGLILRQRWTDIFGRNALWMSFVVALVATSVSLFYSEVAGFVPCVLCWYQRIFMYPLVPLLGLATIRKDDRAIDYALALALIGGGVAAYHVLGGVINEAAIQCSRFGPSCAQVFFVKFGYVTLPVMSLSGFSFILALLLASKRRMSRAIQNG